MIQSRIYLGGAGSTSQNAQQDMLPETKFPPAYKSPPSRLCARASELGEKANRELERGNLPQAAALYSQAIEIASSGTPLPPETFRLFFNRSAVLSRLEQFKEALADADKVLELEPRFLSGYLRRAHALEDLFRYREAAEFLARALSIDPCHVKIAREAERLSPLLRWQDPESVVVDHEMEGEMLADCMRVADKKRVRHMCRWLADSGAAFGKICVRYYGNQTGSSTLRGTHAATSCAFDDVLLFIPSKSIITSELAKQSAIGQDITASKYQLRSSHSYIAAFLLQEKHATTSTWDAYLQVLCALDFSSIPLFFREETLRLLEGSMMIPKLEERHQSLRAEYRDLCKAVASFSQFTYDEFVWARAVVVSRVYGLHIGGTKTDGLVPLGCTFLFCLPCSFLLFDFFFSIIFPALHIFDLIFSCSLGMLNHDVGNAIWGVSQVRGGFVIKATTNIQQGGAITISYGRKCNRHVSCCPKLTACVVQVRLWNIYCNFVSKPFFPQLRVCLGQ